MPGKRILVIDDEDDIREVAQASLEIMAGLDVIVACSSQEGLEKAEAEQPDAILLDVTVIPNSKTLGRISRLRGWRAIEHKVN